MPITVSSQTNLELLRKNAKDRIKNEFKNLKIASNFLTKMSKKREKNLAKYEKMLKIA